MEIIIKNKIRKCNFLNQFDLNKIKIFVPFEEKVNEKLKFKNIGDILVPSPLLGRISNMNANGWEEKEKNKEKVDKLVSTIWLHPYGNHKIPEVAIDIYRKCYQTVFHAPYEIKFQLIENNKKQKIIAAILEKGFEYNIIHIINLFIEIADICYISDSEDFLETKYTFYNWELLPPGELPHNFVKKFIRNKQITNKTFDMHRLEVLDSYEVEERGNGINGFYGYFAYIFDSFCIFESPIYGNATYIVPKENWKELSRMSKKELFDNNFVIKKIIHDKDWERNIKSTINDFRV